MSNNGWSDDMMKKWADAQQNYWNTWEEMVKKGMPNQNNTLNMPSWPDGLQYWWETMTPSTPMNQGDVLQRVVDMGKMYMSMAEQAFNVTQPQAEKNENVFDLWMSAMEQGFQTWSKQLSMGQVPNGDFGLGQMNLEAWNKALKSMGMEQFSGMQMPNMQNFQMPGFEQFQQAFHNNPFQNPQATNPFQAFQTINNPFSQMPNTPQAWADQMRQALGSPAVGYSRESQEAWQKLASLMVDYQEAMQAYLQAFAKQGNQSIEELRERVSKLTAEGQSISSLRDLYNLWVDVNEEAYAVFAMSDEYQVVYGDMVNAFMALKEGMNKQAEQMYRSMNIPTRTEVNSAYEKQQNLKRENRQLKQTLKALEKRVAALESQQTATPTEKVVKETEPMVEAVQEVVEQQTEIFTQAAEAIDDLTKIKGVGPVISEKLYDMGINTFLQMSELTNERMEQLDDVFGSQGRILRENWVGQAQDMLKKAKKDND